MTSATSDPLYRAVWTAIHEHTGIDGPSGYAAIDVDQAVGTLCDVIGDFIAIAPREIWDPLFRQIGARIGFKANVAQATGAQGGHIFISPPEGRPN